MSTNRWIKKRGAGRYIHKHAYVYLHTHTGMFPPGRCKEILPLPTTRMDPEGLLLREISQVEKDKYRTHGLYEKSKSKTEQQRPSPQCGQEKRQWGGGSERRLAEGHKPSAIGWARPTALTETQWPQSGALMRNEIRWERRSSPSSPPTRGPCRSQPTRRWGPRHNVHAC